MLVGGTEKSSPLIAAHPHHVWLGERALPMVGTIGERRPRFAEVDAFSRTCYRRSRLSVFRFMVGSTRSVRWRRIQCHWRTSTCVIWHSQLCVRMRADKRAPSGVGELCTISCLGKHVEVMASVGRSLCSGNAQHCKGDIESKPRQSQLHRPVLCIQKRALLSLISNYLRRYRMSQIHRIVLNKIDHHL